MNYLIVAIALTNLTVAILTMLHIFNTNHSNDKDMLRSGQVKVPQGVSLPEPVYEGSYTTTNETEPEALTIPENVLNWIEGWSDAWAQVQQKSRAAELYEQLQDWDKVLTELRKEAGELAGEVDSSADPSF